MLCKCGGVLDIIKIEKYPKTLPTNKQLLYDRLCDVECIKCGKVYYSQPYDFGKKLNEVKNLND